MESQTDLDAKAISNIASKAAVYSRPIAQLGWLGAVPVIRLCSMFACISCGYLAPAGVGTGFVIPSAVVPKITKGCFDRVIDKLHTCLFVKFSIPV